MSKSRDLADDVIFRRWKVRGDVIAIWPAVDAGWAGGCLMQAYERVGQHGACDYWAVLKGTRPAKPEEYADLLAELKQRGYRPNVIRRVTRKHDDFRRNRR
jgi:hypothetical protein